MNTEAHGLEILIENWRIFSLLDLLNYLKGFLMPDKPLILSCLRILITERIDLVDAYLLAISKKKNIKQIYSFDKDLSKRGLEALNIR